jgi:hypothetical protein
MSRPSLAYQGVHSCIKQSLTVYRLQYVEKLSQIRQCVICSRLVCAQ